MRICEIKNCSTPVFGTDKLTGIGYCKVHQYRRTDKSKKTILQKAMDKAKETHINAAIYNEELSEWFKYHMEHSPKICENCGADLSHYKEKDWKASQHHIIEKSEINGCPSVATELSNHGVLGKWCCHSQWHTSYENAQKMPFFKIAKKRFETFKHLIHKSELRKIPDCFLKQYIEIDI